MVHMKLCHVVTDSHSQARQKDVFSVVSAGYKSETGHHDSSSKSS